MNNSNPITNDESVSLTSAIPIKSLTTGTIQISKGRYDTASIDSLQSSSNIVFSGEDGRPLMTIRPGRGQKVQIEVDPGTRINEAATYLIKEMNRIFNLDAPELHVTEYVVVNELLNYTEKLYLTQPPVLTEYERLVSSTPLYKR